MLGYCPLLCFYTNKYTCLKHQWAKNRLGEEAMTTVKATPVYPIREQRFTRVRDWRGARNRAVRSGAQHRSERGAPQSPTPRSPKGQGG